MDVAVDILSGEIARFETDEPGSGVRMAEGSDVFGRAAVAEALPPSMKGVIGASEPLVDVYRIVDRIADSACNVLITGESGTGKELVARAVHDASSRSDAPFVAVNCGAIPEALLESELFGHARGSFTGAHATKIGRIAMAQGGTLFLDEVGELPLSLQVKLLRVLQSREYSPVGDTRTLTADVRVLAATNVNLEDAVRDGVFREDLYYRLNVIHVQVPALRDRLDDVPLLTHHFLKRAVENTIERAVLLCNGDQIEPRDLPTRVLGLGTERRVTARLPDSGMDLRGAVDAFENQLIRQALDRTNWNKKRAAALLGLNRTTLVEMLKRKRIIQRVA